MLKPMHANLSTPFALPWWNGERWNEPKIKKQRLIQHWWSSAVKHSKFLCWTPKDVTDKNDKTTSGSTAAITKIEEHVKLIKSTADLVTEYPDCFEGIKTILENTQFTSRKMWSQDSPSVEVPNCNRSFCQGRTGQDSCTRYDCPCGYTPWLGLHPCLCIKGIRCNLSACTKETWINRPTVTTTESHQLKKLPMNFLAESISLSCLHCD